MSIAIDQTRRPRYRVRLRTLLLFPVVSALGLYVWPFLAEPHWFTGEAQVALEFIVVDAGDGRPLEGALIRVVDGFRGDKATASQSGRDGRAGISHAFAMRGVNRSYRRTASVSFQDCWLEVSAAGHRSSIGPLAEFTGKRRDLDGPGPPAITVALRDGNDPAPALAGIAGFYCGDDGTREDQSITILPDGRTAFRWIRILGCSGIRTGNLCQGQLTDGSLILTRFKRDDQGEYKTNTEGVQEKIETRIEFLSIAWGERSYLIPSKDVLRFCNAVNQGNEPRNQPRGSGYLRADDRKKPVAGLPELPAEWMPYLLRKPVSGTVLEVLEGEKARVNLGSKDGIRSGMELLLRGNREFFPLTVISVEPDSCVVAPAEWAAGNLEPGRMVASRRF